MAVGRNAGKKCREGQVPDHILQGPGAEGVVSETSGSSGIGLSRGFLEAMSLFPYKDF